MLNTDQWLAGAGWDRKNGLRPWNQPHAQTAVLDKMFVLTMAGTAAALGVWQGSSLGYALALAALALALALLGCHLWGSRHPLRFQASAVSPAPAGLLRSSQPLVWPPLPERSDAADGLFDMVTAPDYRFGALTGPFGSGKTALLRAALLPRLAAAGRPAVYIPSPGSNAMAATREAILAQLSCETNPPPPAVAATADLSALLRMLMQRSGQAGTLVDDDFDAFLLGRNRPQAHDAFVNWLRESVNDASLQVRFLFAVRGDLISRFLALEALVVDGQAGVHAYALSDLTPEDALRLLRQTVDLHETGFEAGLIAGLVTDLTVHGLVSPALLQIVATLLKQREIKTLRQYEREGAAAGILQAYVRRQLADSGKPLVGRAVLQVLARESAGRATVSHTLSELWTAVQAANVASGPDRDGQLLPMLRQFMSARLVMRRSGDVYAVAYPLLRTSIVAVLEELAAAERRRTRRTLDSQGA